MRSLILAACVAAVLCGCASTRPAIDLSCPAGEARPLNAGQR